MTEKIYMPNEWLLKKFKKKKKKKRKKNQKMWSEKEKKMKKKNDGQYEHFLFLFQWLEFGTDACFLLYNFVEIVLLKILLLSSTWGGGRHNSLRK